MKNEETASGWPPSTPEVAVTHQDSSSATTKINLSIEDENHQLREQNSHLVEMLAERDAIIKEQDQRFVAFFKFCVEALNDAADALKVTHPGKRTDKFIDEIGKAVTTATPEGRPFAVVGRIRQIIARMQEVPPLVIEQEKRYTRNTLNQNRARALVDRLIETGRKTMKSTEARAYLEGIEGRPLHRMQVLRALTLVPQILTDYIYEVISTGKPARVRLEDTTCASTDPNRNSLLRQGRRTGAPPG
jgi:hypothetical protein